MISKNLVLHKSVSLENINPIHFFCVHFATFVALGTDDQSLFCKTFKCAIILLQIFLRSISILHLVSNAHVLPASHDIMQRAFIRGHNPMLHELGRKKGLKSTCLVGQ